MVRQKYNDFRGLFEIKGSVFLRLKNVEGNSHERVKLRWKRIFRFS